MNRERDLVWSYDGIRVHYRPELDGAGSRLAPAFAEHVARRTTRPHASAFEWCAGPGFVGFALLADGVCERLCLADVNPAAAECARRTIDDNGLHDRVEVHVGDNLQALPEGARFDLVVANPPNFHSLNPRHPAYARLAHDLRPNDPQWRLHRGFYAGIRRHLLPQAVLYISEVDPDDAVVHIPRDEPEPYDIRPRAAATDFRAMIEQGGLEHVETVPYFTGRDGAELAMMTSRGR